MLKLVVCKIIFRMADLFLTFINYLFKESTMSEYAANLEKTSRALDSNFSTPGQQSSLNEILQVPKERSTTHVVTERRPPETGSSPLQRKTENKTGLPDGMKALLEAKSGYHMNDVRVNYNSSRPAQLSALAYTQGSEIHIAPGQEKHLAHEAWHVAQQKQGRVHPTMQLKGVNVNDDEDLEKEADERGKEMIQGDSDSVQMKATPSGFGFSNPTAPLQMVGDDSREFGYYTRDGKRKSRRVISMEQFGDRNRVHAVDPNKCREHLSDDDVPKEMIDEKTGIWRPSQQDARPEDPPIYPPVRDAYHRAHNIYTCFSAYDNDPNQRLPQYLDVLIKALDLIKKFSVEYKATVRDFTNPDSIKDRKAAYTHNLDRIKNVLIKLSERMLDNYKMDNPLLAGVDNLALGDAKAAEGEELWRGRWWAAIQRVNGILSRKWKEYKTPIQAWIKQNSEEKGLSYMQEDMVGDLEYIGSLAKGYKSPPKQYMHFLPEKFDVDANLDAPPLAVYAISQGEPVDRGRVKSGHLPPLRGFEEAVWDELQQVGGIDLEDKFEVFVQADNIKDLMGTEHADVKEAQQQGALSERFQKIEDRVWRLEHPAESIPALVDWMRSDGLRLKEHSLGREDDDHHTYTDGELTSIEFLIAPIEQELRRQELAEQEQRLPPEERVKVQQERQRQEQQRQQRKEEVANAMGQPVDSIAHPDIPEKDMTSLDRLQRLEHHDALQAPVPPPAEEDADAAREEE